MSYWLIGDIRSAMTGGGGVGSSTQGRLIRLGTGIRRASTPGRQVEAGAGTRAAMALPGAAAARGVPKLKAVGEQHGARPYGDRLRATYDPRQRLSSQNDRGGCRRDGIIWLPRARDHQTSRMMVTRCSLRGQTRCDVGGGRARSAAAVVGLSSDNEVRGWWTRGGRWLSVRAAGRSWQRSNRKGPC
jgi:hypothetical protein